MKLSVIIPVYNEHRTIKDILSKVKNVKIEGVKKELVVVDDFSTDGTRDELAKLKDRNVKVILHQANKGKGCAIRTGLQHATGDIILFQDSDMEYDPNDYGKLISPILDGKADVVYGSRFIGKSMKVWGRGRVILPLHLIGNKLLTFIANVFYGQSLTDMETGYKVFRSGVIKSLNFKAKRFDMEPEITAKLLKKRIKILEVPISYIARNFSEGKKITWRDGILAMWCLIKYRFMD